MQSRADVIHLATPGPVGLAGRIIARRLRLPITGSYHGRVGAGLPVFGGSRPVGGMTDAWVRWLYRPCRPLLVPHHAALDSLILAGHRADHLRLWPPGVDTQQFSPARRSPRLRWLWGVDERRPALAYVGRLSRENGLHLLPLIQRQLAAWGIRHRLVIVGDGPMAAELRARCPDAVFLGAQPHDDVADAMASADVLISPGDTTGAAVLEAQACGLPVIVSDRGGSQEQMVPGRTGLVARTGVAEAFADAVRRIVRDRDTLHDMSRRAREMAVTRRWSGAIRPLVLAWHTAARAGAAAKHVRAQPRDAHV
jgi:glycosyltransferase involved in cell wall biosynthesis